MNKNMKKRLLMAVVCTVAIGVLCACNGNNNTKNQEKMNMKTESKEPVLGLGSPITSNFTGEAWLKRLSSVPEYNCDVYNVTFAPGTRNNWHAHAVGQILLCTEGEGWYQEKDKPAQRLQTGDVVNIPANTMHWHRATAKSRFTHIGITPKVGENTAEWGNPVTDEEYNALPE